MTEKILSRRDFLRAAALGASAAVLGSSNLTALAKPPAQSASITYLDVDESGAGDEAYAIYQQLAEMFMDSNPGIEVKFQPALEGWSDALVTDMVAGVAADIFPHYAGFGRPLMENGQTLALNDYFSAEDLTDFYEEQILAVELEGKLYGLPKYLSSIALAYNKDMLDEAGIDYPGENLDWDSFFTAVSQAAQLGPNESGARFGYNVNLGYSNHWVWQNGGEWMNAPVLGTKILINEPPAAEALQRLYDLVFVDHSAPTVQDIEGLGWPQVFQTGRFAFVEGHSWQVNEWVRTIDFEWDYAPLPAGSAGRIGTVFNDSYSIWQGSSAPDAAAAFLKFISSPEIKEMMMFSVHGWQPPLKSLAESWNTNSVGAQAGKNVKVFSDIALESRQQPYFRNNQEVEQIFGPLWEKIWVTNELNMAEGVEQIATEVNGYLDSL